MTTAAENAPLESGRRETAEVAAAHPLARFFFLKTTFAMLLAMLLLAGGFMAYQNLAKESLPDLDIPQATIITPWPGADPRTIEEQVTQELEDELTTVKGVKSVVSASFDSLSMIIVEFTAETNSRDAMQRLRSAVSDAESDLPADAETSNINQVSVDDRPVMTITLYGDVSDVTLNDLSEMLQDDFETQRGVNEVDLGGAREEIVQILLDPQRLLALGIAPTQVRTAISNANLDQPFGDIESEQFGAVIRLQGQFQSVNDLRNMPVARLGGQLKERAVTLGEIATVEKALAREETRAFYSDNGGEFGKTIEISVKKSPGADTVKLIEAVSARLLKAKAGNGWPEGVEYSITQNEAEQITESLSDVLTNALQAMLAVFIVLFLVLTWREGIIAGLSIPLSFAGALIIIWAVGYTLNELVIIGMVLALGLLVDVFILMMEGLHDEIYTNKKTFGQAALATVKRYGIPAFAGQLTTILALAPLMAISGTSGKFIRVLPVTAIACLVMAFVVALLVSVPLSRLLMGRVANKKSAQGSEAKETRADRIMAAMSNGLLRSSLKVTLRSKKVAALWVAIAFGLFFASLIIAGKIPMELYAKNDGVNLGINIELPPATLLTTSQQVADEVGEILREKPYFESVIKLVGRKSPLASTSLASALQPSSAENFIGFSSTFVEKEQREKLGYELAADLRVELAEYLAANVPGASLLVVPETGSPSAADPIEISITGSDMRELQRISREVQEKVASVSGTADVRDNLGSVKTEIALTPNREAADFYGLNQRDLASQIRFALSNDKIGTFATPGTGDDLDIHMGLQWSSHEGEGGGPGKIEELSLIRAFTPDGETVALMSLLQPTLSEAPTSIVHKDGDRAISVLSKVEGRNLAEVIAEITPLLDEMAENWPVGYAWSIGGESAETAETFGSAGIMLIVALIMVFGVLVIVFGSFSQGFILMMTMPMALIGTFFGFYITGMSLSFFAVIGLISLIGIVANNGIVMVDTMNGLLRDGASVKEAAAQGASARLRPILTTSVTTIVGLLPLALGTPMYAPLCYAIIFGMASSTVLSLVIVPCLYLLLTGKAVSEADYLD